MLRHCSGGASVELDTLSDDALADHVRAVFDELHRRHDIMEPGAIKRGAGVRLLVAHRAMEILREHLAGGGVIQPFSGGDPKPEE